MTDRLDGERARFTFDQSNPTGPPLSATEFIGYATDHFAGFDSLGSTTFILGESC
jgi:hypothetical protein